MNEMKLNQISHAQDRMAEDLNGYLEDARGWQWARVLENSRRERQLKDIERVVNSTNATAKGVGKFLKNQKSEDDARKSKAIRGGSLAWAVCMAVVFLACIAHHFEVISLMDKRLILSLASLAAMFVSGWFAAKVI